MYNPPQQHRRRSRRRFETPSVGTAVTAAVVAYGTYRFASWVWNTWYTDDIDDENVEERQEQQHQVGWLSRILQKNCNTVNSAPPQAAAATATNTSIHPHCLRMRQQRMLRCRDEVNKAMEGFLPTLRRTIEFQTNTSDETKALKEWRAQRTQQRQQGEENDGNPLEIKQRQKEHELWEVIKVRSVTRMVATAYAHTILFLVVTVQVHLLGGRLFAEQMQTASGTHSTVSNDSVASDRMEEYASAHKVVLQNTYKFFFEQGIEALVQSVQAAVTEALQDWSLSDPAALSVSRQSLQDMISTIRAAQEQSSPQREVDQNCTPTTLLRFLLPPTESLDASVEDWTARNILDETFDLLESPVLVDALKDCLDITFDTMRDGQWGKMFQDDDDDDNMDSRVTKPLAQILTRLKHTSKSFFQSQPQNASTGKGDMFEPVVHRWTVNSYCARMEMLPSVQEVAEVSFN